MLHGGLLLSLLLLSLGVLSSGHPHGLETSANVESRGTFVGCPGTASFFVCGDGLRGCFAHDPCLSTGQVSSVETCGSGLTASTIFAPVMFDIHPAQPNLPAAALHHLQLHSKQECEEALEQVMVFTNVPPEAKTCTLRWAQSSITERVFVVQGSGLVSLKQLTGFPANEEPINAHTIRPYEPEDRLFNVDFTSWDQITTATTHIGGPVRCGPEIYLKAAINTLNGDGQVYFEQDAKNGFYIEYAC